MLYQNNISPCLISKWYLQKSYSVKGNGGERAEEEISLKQNQWDMQTSRGWPTEELDKSEVSGAYD